MNGWNEHFYKKDLTSNSRERQWATYNSTTHGDKEGWIERQNGIEENSHERRNRVIRVEREAAIGAGKLRETKRRARKRRLEAEKELQCNAKQEQKQEQVRSWSGRRAADMCKRK